MRICFAVETYPSVTQTFVSEPVGWLERAGHRVAVVAAAREDLPGGDGLGLVSRTLDRSEKRRVLVLALLKHPRATAGTILQSLRIRRRRRFWYSHVVAAALLEEVRQADVVVAHFGPTGQLWLPVASLARRRFAVYFHGFDVGTVLRRDPNAYADLFASGAALLTNSEYLKGRLVEAGAPEERVAVVRLGVNPELAGTTSRPAAGGAGRLLTIGRLVPKKGIEESIRAFAAARPQLGPDWSYHIVGDGPLRPEARAARRRGGASPLDLFPRIPPPERDADGAPGSVPVRAGKQGGRLRRHRGNARRPHGGRDPRHSRRRDAPRGDPGGPARGRSGPRVPGARGRRAGTGRCPRAARIAPKSCAPTGEPPAPGTRAPRTRRARSRQPSSRPWRQRRGSRAWSSPPDERRSRPRADPDQARDRCERVLRPRRRPHRRLRLGRGSRGALLRRRPGSWRGRRLPDRRGEDRRRRGGADRPWHAAPGPRRRRIAVRPARAAGAARPAPAHRLPAGLSRRHPGPPPHARDSLGAGSPPTGRRGPRQHARDPGGARRPTPGGQPDRLHVVRPRCPASPVVAAESPGRDDDSLAAREGAGHLWHCPARDLHAAQHHRSPVRTRAQERLPHGGLPRTARSLQAPLDRRRAGPPLSRGDVPHPWPDPLSRSGLLGASQHPLQRQAPRTHRGRREGGRPRPGLGPRQHIDPRGPARELPRGPRVRDPDPELSEPGGRGVAVRSLRGPLGRDRPREPSGIRGRPSPTPGQRASARTPRSRRTTMGRGDAQPLTLPGGLRGSLPAGPASIAGLQFGGASGGGRNETPGGGA